MKWACNQVYAYGGSMIFPEMVRILFLKGSFYLFIFDWKMAEMGRPMDFWKGGIGKFSFFSSTLQMINAEALRTRLLLKPWSSLPTLCTMDTAHWHLISTSLFHYLFSIYTSHSKGNLPYNWLSRASPNSPGKVLVRMRLLLEKCNCWHVAKGNIIILITGIIAAGTSIWKYWDKWAICIFLPFSPLSKFLQKMFIGKVR